MQINVDIFGDVEVKAALVAMTAPQAQKAISTAVRKTANRGSPLLSKAIRQKYKISAKRIKQDIPKKASKINNFKYHVRASYEPITAMSFAAKAVKRGGISFSIYKGSNVRIPKGFIASPSGQSHSLPFVRMKKASKYVGRLPLRVIMGPSISGITLGKSKEGVSIMDTVERQMINALETEVKRVLDGMARGFGR